MVAMTNAKPKINNPNRPAAEFFQQLGKHELDDDDDVAVGGPADPVVPVLGLVDGPE